MVFEKSIIILDKSEQLAWNIFRDFSFTHGKFQPTFAFVTVTYKTVAYEKSAYVNVDSGQGPKFGFLVVTKEIFHKLAVVDYLERVSRMN